jgi:integrase
MASISKFHLPGCSGGACECQWCLDYRPLGVGGPRQRLRFKTRKEAERFLTDTAHKASRGEFVDPAKIPKFAEVAEDWLRSKLDRRPSHVSDLRTRLDKHLMPRFGTRRLNTITVAELEDLRDDLRDRGYAPMTINQVLRIASSIFRLAIKRGQCAANPLDRVDRAYRAAREIKPGDNGADDEVGPDNILDPDEVRRLLDAAQSGLERTLFLTAFVTGARQGELLALRWSDLELPKEDSGKMAIRRGLSWARVMGEEIRPRYFPPKTKSGRRVIQIPKEVVAALKRWKLQCPKSGEDLVFPMPDGGPLRRDRLLRRHFHPALARARLRRVTFHSLRHSCASAMIAGGPPSRRFRTSSATATRRSHSVSTATGSETPRTAAGLSDLRVWC